MPVCSSTSRATPSADRVTAVAAAVADGSAPTLRLALGESSGISRLLQPGETHAGDEPAKSASCRSISSAPTADSTPQVIKIDVEGAELAVLRGARSTVAAAGPGLQLFVEMHPHLWTASASRSTRCAASARRRTWSPNGWTAARGTDLWQTEGVCLRLRPRRMRIVVAHDSVGTEGGVETYLLSVIQALRSRGHQIALVYDRRSEAAEPACARARTSRWASRSEASMRS